MPITLKQEQEKFVLDKLQQGKYENADELFAIAFELLEKNEQKEQEIIQLKEKILEGKKQIKEGKITDGEIVFQRLQAKLKQVQ
ncbi:MAG: type II toxin-antitoxin system ParD family antitoxin [Microcystis novacekii Mn_MB_F_20050700_S1]|uniref:Type II toxin-antitoxin system ParD family antitoxin n=1 Tax=Microcystis novacekii Mn_MB_F_20050700_S1D TaxID=2486266 RepID=A0A552IWD1_9CHRO|nr:MAG: type II toxin-antitoxin system ParD family antitoxin [Microcystis novacekii Mn_MB_F_20050700_S1D]TRU91313.1 MAG: type II toxin-antitoxin system ParD family antitoxin [Microcystis novacekii Mn_MB_F_20050700_S1]